MGIKRVVDVDFWNDEKVMDMFSPEDKLFMLYLLTNPHTTQLGIYAINPKHISFETGYSVEVVSVLLDRFENNYKLIKYSHKTKEIAIKNFLKHSIVKGGKPVEDCLTKEIAKVKDKSLLQFIYEGISEHEALNHTVKNILSLLNVNDNDIDNENDNDNDNERIVNESSTNRTTNRQNFVPPSLEEVKAYCEERKNGINAEAFIDFYTAKGWLIGKNKMKDWKAAVRTWERHEHTNNKGVSNNGSNQQHTSAGTGKYGTWL